MAQEMAPSGGPVPTGQQEKVHAWYCKSGQEPMVREPTEQQGVSQGTEKMEKRICVFCPKDNDWSVIYFAPSANIAAHENCLLYSSGLVECEDPDQRATDRNFDVKSVKKEIWRGQRLRCSFCKNKGATVGCDESSCSKNYHLLCSQNDRATLQVDYVHGTYKLFCQQHGPKQEETTQSADCPSEKKKREREKDLSPGPPAQPPKKKCGIYKSHMTEKPRSLTGAVFKVPFLKKCKDAGLLTELFEGILEKMDLIHARLMDETTSDSDYKKIETLLFGSGLFEDTLITFQEVIKRKACECEEMQRKLKQQLEALEDLKEILWSVRDNGDQGHSSSTSVSLEDHQLKCQECAKMQAGSEDSP